MQEKICTKCGEIKPLNVFFKDKNHKDDLQSLCKECVNQASFNYKRTKKGRRQAASLGVVTITYSFQHNI